MTAQEITVSYLEKVGFCEKTCNQDTKSIFLRKYGCHDRLESTACVDMDGTATFYHSKAGGAFESAAYWKGK